MDKASLERLWDEQFRRLTGLKRPVFSDMIRVLHASQRRRKGGNRRRLSLEACLLMTLEYWREYRTQFHIAHSYGVDEATVNRTIRWVEDTLIKSGAFSLPGKKALRTTDVEYSVVLVDATETPIERPKKNSGVSIPARRSGTR
jgi:Helix-turn-helix of DDE superfamily endonuclease